MGGLPVRPKALDLFCGGGGVSRGLDQAGFDVVGVDLHPQPDYPYPFIQADALSLGFNGFDFVWASPPCQAHSAATRDKKRHKDLIAPVRSALFASEIPWVIENVAGAPLHDPVMLCGAMFGLGTIRHRFFESSFTLRQPEHPKHIGSVVTGEYVTVAGNGGVPTWTFKERAKRKLPRHIPGEMTLERWQEAMGIDWLPRKPLVQAIPPAFAKWIGEQVMLYLWERDDE